MVDEYYFVFTFLGFFFFITLSFYESIISMADDDELYYEVLKRTKKELMELKIYKAHRRKWLLIYLVCIPAYFFIFLGCYLLFYAPFIDFVASLFIALKIRQHMWKQEKLEKAAITKEIRASIIDRTEDS